MNILLYFISKKFQFIQYNNCFFIEYLYQKIQSKTKKQIINFHLIKIKFKNKKFKWKKIK